MTDVNDLNINQTLVAFDIAKQSHDAVIRLPNAKTKTVKFLNNRAGYQQLLDHRGDPASSSIRAAFEPTTDYLRSVAYWLQTNGVDCFLVSSLSRARERLDKTWDKQDRKDARATLYLLM